MLGNFASKLWLQCSVSGACKLEQFNQQINALKLRRRWKHCMKRTRLADIQGLKLSSLFSLNHNIHLHDNFIIELPFNICCDKILTCILPERHVTTDEPLMRYLRCTHGLSFGYHSLGTDQGRA